MYDKIDLKRIGQLVHEILKNEPDARSSDSVLYYKVLEVYGKRKGYDIESMSIPQLFLRMAGEFPNYESVRRSRQKVQANHPELCASKEVALFREENRQAYYEYAKDEE